MSEKNLLEIKDLHVNVEDKEILHGVNLEVGKDEVHVLMARTEPENLPSAMPSPDTRNTPSHPDRSSLTEKILQKCRSMSVPKKESSFLSRIHS